METLPDIKKNNAVAVYESKGGQMAVKVLRDIITLPEVVDGLEPVEKYILIASTKKQLFEMDDEELTGKLDKLFRFIAVDVGYNIPANKSEWAYSLTRFFEILRRYYNHISITDIKLAFELLTTGELDDYLPKDSKGNPEKKHYQQFNTTYLSNVLNAYRKRQSEVVAKAYEKIPTREKEITKDERKKYRNYLRNKVRRIFIRYKYQGILELNGCDDIFCYRFVNYLGYAEKVEETPEDRKKAYTRYFQRFKLNKYDAARVRKEGTDSIDINHYAIISARTRAVMHAFDDMLSESVNIDNLITFE